MIFLDVTGACLLELEAGIPRTTRGIWRLLQNEAPGVTAVFWQPFRGKYTELSARSQRLLNGSFVAARRPPRDSTLSLLRASFGDLLQRPKAVELIKSISKEDVLLITSIFPDNRLGYLQKLARQPGRKMAIFHDAIPLRDPNVAGWERSRHLGALRTLAGLDLVIAVSESAAADLRALWKERRIEAGKVAVLPWPVPFEGRRPARSEPAAEPKRILYVSRLKQVKNHAILFNACEKLWNDGLRFELELIGCEDEAAESGAIRRRMEQMQREGRAISWRAQVSEDELHQAYQHASFTVFPSLMEGFGLPVMESLWHGRPVICGQTGAVAESARGGGCVMIDVRDASALADGMRELLQDEKHRLKLASEAQDRVFRTWNDYGRELKQLLEAG